MHLLDSNILSAAMATDAAVMTRLARADDAGLAISSLTLGEVLYGLEKLSAKVGPENGSLQRKRVLLRQLLDHIDVLDWDADAAEAYAAERVSCESDGHSLATLDLMILAHAASTGRTLVTRDTALQRRDRQGPYRTRVVGW